MTMLEIIQERAGDIEFAHEARRIYDQISRLVKKRMWSVLKPNGPEPILDRWDGVHVSLPDLGVTNVPEILQDLVLVFAWGTPDAPLSGAAFYPPHELYPSGIILLAYNIGKADRQPFKISRSAKRARAKLRHITKNTEVLEDEDVIQFVPQLMDARRTAFIHELRHAYDQLVRDDGGQMDDYMAKSTEPSNDKSDKENFSKNFTSDDELNAYITQGMEDTIEDFLKNSRNKPTKAKAKRWAPNGTVLWNRFLGNVAGAVKHYNGEEKLMKRAAARVADVWDDYVQKLDESRIVESADDIQDEIEELMRLPEFKSLDAFVEMKFDDEEEHYGTVELQALARNLYLSDNKQLKARDLASAPSSYREKVKKELDGYGLLFSPRKAPKSSRGFSSPINGSNRFAGNHGGSGFTNAYNREPSSGRQFDPNDSGALGMGSKRK